MRELEDHCLLSEVILTGFKSMSYTLTLTGQPSSTLRQQKNNRGSDRREKLQIKQNKKLYKSDPLHISNLKEACHQVKCAKLSRSYSLMMHSSQGHASGPK